MKAFETWILEDVMTTFGLEKNNQSKLLIDWLKAELQPTDFQKQALDLLRDKLFEYVNTWNEDELKFHFIAPFINLVNFTTKHYKLFTQRTLTSTINGIEVGGRVDAMVATGLQRPKEPFFFLHEYKPSRRSSNNDPEGQLLIALLAAQTNNTHPHPVFGAVVEGRAWYFWVLKDKEYAISNTYNATDEDIFKIFAILCKAKEYIEMEIDKISKTSKS